MGVQGGAEADVPQDVGHVHGARARVVEADHAAMRQQQFISQVDLERSQTLLGEECSCGRIKASPLMR